MPETSVEYSFLHALTESEAAAHGVNLSDRNLHALYKTIRAQSNVRNAKKGALFSLDSVILDEVELSHQDRIAALRKLLIENLIVQLFRLVHQGGVKLSIVPCFISVGEDDRNDLNIIYRETIAYSVENIERLLESLPGFQREGFINDLELDLQSEGPAPTPDAIPSSIVGILEGITPTRFDIVPSPEMVLTSRHDIAEELRTREKLVPIPGYGWMPLRNKYLKDRFETAAAFMEKRIVPLYKNKGALKRTLNQIALEKEAHDMEEFAPRTAAFSVKQAKALAQVIEIPPGGDSVKNVSRAPGALAIQTVIQLESKVEEIYKEDQRANHQKIVQDWKGRMLDSGATWEEMITFLTEDDFRKFPPPVRDSLVTDRNLLYGIWEQTGQSVHVFLRNDPYAFRALVTGMSKIGPDRYWQVLAMRYLLDKYDEHFENLFGDPEFVHLYGKLLRQVYITYMPWYHRLILFLGITLFQDGGFNHAKLRIREQQSNLHVRNKEKSTQRDAKKEAERKERMDRILEKSTQVGLMDKLDSFYFAQKKIPSINDILSASPETDSARLRKALQVGGFQILSVKSDENPDDAIVVYPTDHEWRARISRLRKVMSELRDSMRNRPEEDFEKKLFLSRVEKLERHITRSLSGSGNRSPAVTGESQDDPYDRFETELKIHEKRKGSSQPESLEEMTGEADPYEIDQGL